MGELMDVLSPALSSTNRAKTHLRGKKPKPSNPQHKELRRMYDIDEYFIKERAEMFSISRPTVYRTLGRQAAAA